MDELKRIELEHRSIRGFTESYYSSMKKRATLQSIGNYIYDGGNDSVIHYHSFKEREQNAFNTLESYLIENYEKKSANDIMEQINEYVCTIEQIAFSLGMKAGATLLCKLTDNFETDI